MCQCPVSGSRLCTKTEAYTKMCSDLCQCPVSGSRLCTAENVYHQILEKLCVNALSRAHVSARRNMRSYKHDAGIVSMPCLGLTSLHFSALFISTLEKMCQCPVSGSRLCTIDFSDLETLNTMCQCPVSGSRLCTLPLKNLSIYTGFKPCFFVYFSELSDFCVQ